MIKQVTQSYRTGELRLAQVPAPQLQPKGVLVRTHASLISSGTEKMVVDLARQSLLGKARQRPDLVRQVVQKMKTEGVGSTLQKVWTKLDEPIALGYACAGVVIEVGRDVDDLAVGQSVACGGAGFATHAEMNFVPKQLCVPIPTGVDFESASFATVGAIAMQGVRQADVRLGESVVVIGLGLIGLITIQLLKAAGCQVIGVDVDPQRCALAGSLGVLAVSPEQALSVILDQTEGRGADAVLMTAATSSNGPIELAAEACRQKGRVVVVGLIGMQVPRDPFYKKELDLRLSMSTGPGRYDDQYEQQGIDYPYGYVRWTERRNMASFLALVADQSVKLDPIMTHRFDIDQVDQAYELLSDRTGPTDKKTEGVSKKSSATQLCGRGVLETPEFKSPLGILLHYGQALTATADTVVSSTDLIQSSQYGAAPSAGKVSWRQAIGDWRRSCFEACFGTSSSTLGVGWVGAGQFARSVLMPAMSQVRDQCYPVGVCSATGMKAVSAAEKFSFEYATTSIDRLLDDPDVDVLIATTPHHLHASLVQRAILAGKPILVEKPLAINVEQLAGLDQAVASIEASVPLSEQIMPSWMVGFNRRFSPHTQAACAAFENRTGPMVVNYRVSAGVIDPSHWLHDPALGGGRIVGEMCHFVDLCEHLIGSTVKQIYAQSVVEQDVRYCSADSIIVTMQYHDGSMATIQYLAHGGSALGKERVEIAADGRTVVIDQFAKTTQYDRRRRTICRRPDKGFKNELSAWLTSVAEGTSAPIRYESARRTTLTTFAILQSLQQAAPIEYDAYWKAYCDVSDDQDNQIFNMATDHWPVLRSA